jgi:SAM-dependent methyltransferase
MSEFIEKHYREFAGESRSCWIHRKGYADFWAGFLVSEMNLVRRDRILDLGGGKGDLSKALASKLAPVRKITCVDPSQLMLDRVKNPSVKVECGNAIDFLSASKEGSFDAIIMKQVIHHIAPRGRKELYELIYRALSPGGRVAVLTMPETIMYPMFRAAVKGFENAQIRHSSLSKGIGKAGFSLKVLNGDYPVRISWEKYSEAVRERYISDLRCFSYSRIERGLEEVKKSLKNPARLFFHDRLVTFIGTKPE